jgi:hypothetical protein
MGVCILSMPIRTDAVYGVTVAFLLLCPPADFIDAGIADFGMLGNRFGADQAYTAWVVVLGLSHPPLIDSVQRDRLKFSVECIQVGYSLHGDLLSSCAESMGLFAFSLVLGVNRFARL